MSVSIYRDGYKYQLIHPIVGTRVYKTNSLNKGAKKCYEELKSLNNINSEYFTILNIDTYQTFKFKINKQQLVGGGHNNNNNNNNNINMYLSNLDARISRLEDICKVNQNHTIGFEHTGSGQISVVNPNVQASKTFIPTAQFTPQITQPIAQTVPIPTTAPIVATAPVVPTVPNESIVIQGDEKQEQANADTCIIF